MMSSYKTTKDKCPLCGNKLYWSCRGKTGFAHCSKSIYASRVWNDRFFCNWKGSVIRKDSGTVYFIIDSNN